MTKAERVRVFNQERLKEEVSIGIDMLMEKQGVRRTDLAERLGTYKSYVTKMLESDHNFTLEKLADVFWALGHAVHIDLVPGGFEEMRVPTVEVEAAEEVTPTQSNFFFIHSKDGGLRSWRASASSVESEVA